MENAGDETKRVPRFVKYLLKALVQGDEAGMKLVARAIAYLIQTSKTFAAELVEKSINQVIILVFIHSMTFCVLSVSAFGCWRDISVCFWSINTFTAIRNVFLMIQLILFCLVFALSKYCRQGTEINCITLYKVHNRYVSGLKNLNDMNHVASLQFF